MNVTWNFPFARLAIPSFAAATPCSAAGLLDVRNACHDAVHAPVQELLVPRSRSKTYKVWPRESTSTDPSVVERVETCVRAGAASATAVQVRARRRTAEIRIALPYERRARSDLRREP